MHVILFVAKLFNTMYSLFHLFMGSRRYTSTEKPKNGNISPRVRRHKSIESGSHLKMIDQFTGREFQNSNFETGFHLKMGDR